MFSCWPTSGTIYLASSRGSNKTPKTRAQLSTFPSGRSTVHSGSWWYNRGRQQLSETSPTSTAGWREKYSSRLPGEININNSNPPQPIGFHSVALRSLARLLRSHCRYYRNYNTYHLQCFPIHRETTDIDSLGRWARVMVEHTYQQGQ